MKKVYEVDGVANAKQKLLKSKKDMSLLSKKGITENMIMGADVYQLREWMKQLELDNA